MLSFLFHLFIISITALTFLMYNLAKNEEVQERCREEVIRIVADKPEVEWYV